VALEPELGLPSVYYDLSDDLVEQTKRRARAGSGGGELAPMGILMTKSKRSSRGLVVLDRLLLLIDEYREQLECYAALRLRLLRAPENASKEVAVEDKAPNVTAESRAQARDGAQAGESTYIDDGENGSSMAQGLDEERNGAAEGSEASATPYDARPGGEREGQPAYPAAAAQLEMVDSVMASLRAKIADLDTQLKELRPTFEELNKASQ
jgi:hypothetical protein